MTEEERIEEKILTDEERIRRIVREERDKEREMCIQIRRLEGEDSLRLRKSLKKRVFKMVSGIPCTIKVTDDEGADIRGRDGW